MAIKISGSTIIDDSRNIVNAGVVTATSFYGDGSNLTNISSGGGSIAGINTLGTSHFNNLNITGFATFANGGRAIFEDILEFRGLEAGGANTLDWYDSGGVVDHSIIYNGESFDIGGGDQVKLDASGIGTVFITSAGVSVAEFTEDTVKFYNAVTETETLRITSAGLVGIGTDSPDHKLQVDYTSDDDGFVINNTFRGGKWRFATSGSIGQNFDIRRYDSVNDTYRRFLNLGSDEFSVYTGVTTSSIERLRVTSTGLVGIGTDSPDTLLNLFGTGNTTIKVHNNSATAGTYSRLQLITGGSGSSARSEIRSLRMSASSAATDLVFFTTTAGDTSPTERLRITSVGNVGIGTIDPTVAVGSANTAVLAAGIVTAYKFYGDGSCLTNLPSSGIATEASFLKQDADGNILAGDSTTGGGYDPATGTSCFNIFMGCNAGNSINGGDNNFFAGSAAGKCTTTGEQNTFIGFKAGRDNIDGSANNFLGFCAGHYNQSGNCNNFIGFLAGLCNTTGNCNNFLGRVAGRCNTTGSNNNFFGNAAGLANTTGSCNNMIGLGAGACATVTGTYNTFLGTYAGKCASGFGFNNNFIGRYAGCLNTTGNENNFIGFYAGSCNTTGTCNIFIGSCAGKCNTTGSYNVFFGLNAGFSNTTGLCNNMIGRGAGRCATVTGFNNNFFGTDAGRCARGGGFNNNFIGFEAGCNNTTGSNNNFIGNEAGKCNSTGGYNNFIGREAGRYSTEGCNNNFIGCGAGKYNTTGSNNNFIGFCAGKCNTTGSNNNFFGQCAGHCNTTGGNNNMIGCGAGQCATVTGQNNNFFGTFAGRFASGSGCNNNFFGNSAGYNNTGDNNNFIGTNAGCNNTSGDNNNFFGNCAGSTQTTGDCNTIIGYNVQLPNTTGGCQLAIGVGTNRWITGDSSFNISATGTVSLLSTAQATTSGTTKTFTDVPATANKITIMFNQVGHAALFNRQIQVRLGTSGGIISTGYSSIGYNQSGSATQNRTDCFVIYEQTPSVALSGHMLITKLDSTTYISSHQLRSSTTTGREGAGHLQSISGTIDRIEISIQNKDFTFDSGSINVLYE